MREGIREEDMTDMEDRRTGVENGKRSHAWLWLSNHVCFAPVLRSSMLVSLSTVLKMKKERGRHD